MIIDQEKQTQANLHLESHNYQITFVIIDSCRQYGILGRANKHNSYLSRETSLAAEDSGEMAVITGYAYA